MSREYPYLPSDKYIASVLGLTDVEYYYFKKEAQKRYLEQPAPAAVAGLETLAIISIVLTVLSTGLTIVASFFKPKPGRPAQLKNQNDAQDSINSVERYSPRVGFDSSQDIAKIGQTIPLIYTRRETINNVIYGGLRFNTPLLWSQLESLGGSQRLRALFLLGEGAITSIDTTNFAIGSNALGGYLFQGNALNDSRISIFFRNSGGRVASTDLITGKPDVTPLGNYFSASAKPSTQTVFGLYSPIGNNLGYKVNPNVRPAVQAQLVPQGKKGDARVVCDRDFVGLSQRQKYRAYFSSRSGLIGGNVNSVGATCTYQLFRSSDTATDFSVTGGPSGWRAELSIESNPFDSIFGFLRFRSTSLNVGNGVFVTDAQLLSLVSLTSPTVNSANETVSTTATFNTTAAAELLKGLKEGGYAVNYTVSLINENTGDSEDRIVIQSDFDISISQDKTTDFTITNDVLVTDPSFTFDPATNQITKTSGTTVTVQGDLSAEEDYNLTFAPVQQIFSRQYNSEQLFQEKSGDVAASVAARQKSWDDALQIGELYRIGSALAVCTGRTNDVFQSEVDLAPIIGGKSITADFKTIRAGQTTTYSQATLEANGNASVDRRTATNGPHIFRIAIANINTTRECEIVEVGLRSTLGTRINGLLNYKDTLSFDEADARACFSKEGRTVRKGDTLKVSQFSSGTLTTSVERYSFFRISYREAGSTGGFADLGACFGIRGVSQQNTFNSIRLVMPSKKRWEVRFEPQSGWEIRSGIATGQLFILDSKLESVVSYTSASVTSSFKGVEVSRDKNTFTIGITQRGDIGTPRPDEDNYVDAWGKLAEAFVCEEVTTSTQSPEHEIVYVNEILNDSNPNYDDLATIGISVRSSFEWQAFTQFSCYITGGINNTHLFPEILADILINSRYGLGHTITSAQIDQASFAAATTWCRNRLYFFDGVISERQNVRQWAADVAATMLLIFGEADGKFFLKPALTFSPVQIKGLFTAGNILENSFNLQYFDAEERLPIQVSIKYREERSNSSTQSPGLFPLEREILIREATTDDTETVEKVDVTDYATSRAHAIDAAKFIIRMRRVPTHAVKFQTTYEGLVAALQPGDYINFALDTTFYDEFNNGAVTGDGALVSTRGLTDGTYTVIAWNGTGGSLPTDQQLVVTNNGTRATPTGVVFSVKNSTSQVRTYQIESITPDEEGSFTIEAVHMPTDANGFLQLVSDWDSASAWIIQE